MLDECNNGDFMRWMMILTLIGLVVFIGSHVSDASNDQVYFYDDADGNHESNFVLVGEDYLYMQIIFSNNCSKYSIEISSPLFKNRIYGNNTGEFNEGMRSKAALNIDPDAAEGTYEFTIYFNYTLSNGTKVSKSFEKSVLYITPISEPIIKIPSGKERDFEVTFETYVEFTFLTIRFDGDGDIDVETSEINLTNLETGGHSLGTKVIKGSGSGNQKLAYHIIAIYQNHTIEKYRYNINVDMDWDNQSDDTLKIGNNTFFLIIVLIVIIVMFNVIWIRIRKKHRY
jgi:hypothetical protein